MNTGETDMNPLSRIIYPLLSLFLLGVILAFPIGNATAGQDSFTAKDRELLIRLDERLNQIDKRFEDFDKRLEELREDMNKRFEQVDKRFEQIDKRFEQVDQRFSDIITLMTGIVASFAGIVVLCIGFAIWDRRTMIRPFEDKVEKIKDDILDDRKRLNQLFDALRKYASKDKELAEILRTFSIL